jgi:hypothetical protein
MPARSFDTPPATAANQARFAAQIAQATRDIELVARRSDDCRRLVTVPGIGPLGATALVAAVGNGAMFTKGRELAAWLGLVPRQHSTGGKPTLLGISKRGNRYLRMLFIHGARSCLKHLNRDNHELGLWMPQLEQRRTRTSRRIGQQDGAHRVGRVLRQRSIVNRGHALIAGSRRHRSHQVLQDTSRGWQYGRAVPSLDGC